MNITLDVKTNKEITQDDFVGCEYIGTRGDDAEFLLDFGTVKCYIDENDASKLKLELLDVHCEKFNKAVPRFEDVTLTAEKLATMDFACIKYEVETATYSPDEINFSVLGIIIEDNCKVYEVPSNQLSKISNS